MNNIERAKQYLLAPQGEYTGNLCVPARNALKQGTLLFHELHVEGNPQLVHDMRSAMKDLIESNAPGMTLLLQDMATDEGHAREIFAQAAIAITTCAYESKNSWIDKARNGDKVNQAHNKRFTDGYKTELRTFFDHQEIMYTTHGNHVAETHPRYFPLLAIASIRFDVVSKISRTITNKIIGAAAKRYGSEYDTSAYFLPW